MKKLEACIKAKGIEDANFKIDILKQIVNYLGNDDGRAYISFHLKRCESTSSNFDILRCLKSVDCSDTEKSRTVLAC